MQQNLQNKKGLVENVFNQVYNKYDLMNDFMSMGIHRYWKKSLINMINPRVGRKLIDVACGTGDVGKLFLDNTNKEASLFVLSKNNFPTSPVPHATSINFLPTLGFIILIKLFFQYLCIPIDIKSFIKSYLL